MRIDYRSIMEERRREERSSGEEIYEVRGELS